MEIIEYNSYNDIYVLFHDEYKYITRSSYKHFKNRGIKNPYSKTVYGVGYMGVGAYKASVGGENIKSYKVWEKMLGRCYDVNYQNKQPSYIGCTVCSKWHNFQNFAKWYDENVYYVKCDRVELDKDILIKNNKIYSEDTCVFVPKSINTLFTKRTNHRGALPLGVTSHGESKYRARISKDGKRVSLGLFNNKYDAFLAYKKHKELYIKEIANKFKNEIPDRLHVAMCKYVVEMID